MICLWAGPGQQGGVLVGRRARNILRLHGYRALGDIVRHPDSRPRVLREEAESTVLLRAGVAIIILLDYHTCAWYVEGVPPDVQKRAHRPDSIGVSRIGDVDRVVVHRDTGPVGVDRRAGEVTVPVIVPGGLAHACPITGDRVVGQIDACRLGVGC